MKMKFRLLRGRHAVTASQAQGPEKQVIVVTKTYVKGDIVESDVDLVKKSGANKWEEVEGDVPAPKPAVDLDSMTVQQLKQYAATEEIDLDDTTKKDEIITLIRMALETR